MEEEILNNTNELQATEPQTNNVVEIPIDIIDFIDEDEVKKKTKMLTRIRQEFGLNEMQMSILLGMQYDRYLHLEFTPMVVYNEDYDIILKKLSVIGQPDINSALNPILESVSDYADWVDSSNTSGIVSPETIETIQNNDELFRKKKAMRNNIDKIRASLGLD